MSNRLKPVEVSTIRLLWERGWSRRRIARELGLDRGTVRKYVQGWLSAASADPPEGCSPKPATEHLEVTAAKPASEHIGTEEQIPAGSKPASDHLEVVEHRSVCQPYAQLIQSKLDQGLSAQRIFQDLRSEQGFAGSYHSVRRYVRRLRPRQTLPFRRMEAAPGDEVQVDFGQGAWIVDGQGKKRRPHLFRMVLSHSRKAYSEVVQQQTADAFLQCLENAFHHFGGVTKTVVIDNLKCPFPRCGRTFVATLTELPSEDGRRSTCVIR